MKLKGKTLKAAPVDLGMLQTWLGKLLDLPCPPSTEECMEGKILVAALHKVSSRHPMAPSSSVELLLGRREPEAGACGTFERLEAEMLDAGLKQQTPLLGQVAAGDVPALEKLLLAIYQFYALNHAHKFDRTKQPNNATPFGNAAPSPVSLDEAPTSPQMPLAAHGAAQDHRRPPQQRVSAASDQLPLAGGGARAQVARESLRRREDPEQAGDGQALCGFQGEDIVQNFAEQPETVCGSRCLAPLSLGSPPSGEPVSEAEPAWAEGGGVIEDPNDRTPSVRDSSGSEQGRMLVASLTATTPRHSAHRKPIRAAEAPKGAAEGKWMEPSLRCLAAWLGGVIGERATVADTVGRASTPPPPVARHRPSSVSPPSLAWSHVVGQLQRLSPPERPAPSFQAVMIRLGGCSWATARR